MASTDISRVVESWGQRGQRGLGSLFRLRVRPMPVPVFRHSAGSPLIEVTTDQRSRCIVAQVVFFEMRLSFYKHGFGPMSRSAACWFMFVFGPDSSTWYRSTIDCMSLMDVLLGRGNCRKRISLFISTAKVCMKDKRKR